MIGARRRARCRPAPARLLAAALIGLAAAPAAHAQMFHLYLNCQGKVATGKGTFDARLDLAMRDNNQTALVQNSNVLPVGERMRYEPTQQAYTMTFHAPGHAVVAYRAWWSSPIFIWYPPLSKLAHVRLAVDRQTGDLSGQMLTLSEEVLGTLAMRCTPSRDEDQPQPKF
ncbi:MAG: hypothetical protein QM766_08430 [Burkholderiaceae bacterium]